MNGADKIGRITADKIGRESLSEEGAFETRHEG